MSGEEDGWAIWMYAPGEEVGDHCRIDWDELDALLGYTSDPPKPTVADALISWHRSKKR